MIDFKIVVPAIVAGDKTARDALMTEFYPWSISVAARYVRDMDDAATIAVDFWEWLLGGGGIQQYAPTGGFLAWMAACIRQMALKRVRDNREPFTSGEIPDYEAGGDDPADVAAARELRYAMLRAMDDEHLEVLLHLLDGRDAVEIATLLRIGQYRAKRLIVEARRLATAALVEG